MPQRLATNYASAYFTMGEDELDQFVSMIADENILVNVKIFDNGDRDIFIEDDNSDIQLTFRRLHAGNRFACSGSYLITDLTLANAMRKAMKKFKGHGIVHRIYDSFTVIYHYDEGSVVRIEELTDDQETVLFEAENRNRAKELEELFQRTDTEQKIAQLRLQTDRLLDMRNWAKQSMPKQIPAIDKTLVNLSQQLFLLEA